MPETDGKTEVLDCIGRHDQKIERTETSIPCLTLVKLAGYADVSADDLLALPAPGKYQNTKANSNS